MAIELSRKCDNCDEPIDVGDPCTELFSGELGRSKRNNALMVMDAVPEDVNQDPDPAVVVHNHCLISFIIDNIDDTVPDDPLDGRCMHCDGKLPPQICPYCDMPQIEE
jgi:hypothetical protein